MTQTLNSSVTETGEGPAESDLLGTYRRAPMTFLRGAGVELFDEQGKAYLDFASGIAVNALGHGDAGIKDAMERAMASGLIHVSNLYRTEPAERLASSLVARSFASKVFLCNSGAEANEGAFKFARKWARTTASDRKTGIVALRGAFHGRLFASLAATDRPSYRAPFEPLAGGVSIHERDLSDLEAALDGELVAALIVEPVQGEGGVRVLDADLLRSLRSITTRRRIALIFDEIQCGLGRLGTFLAHESFGVVPDMVTLAKPMAGGLPMGAVLVSREISETISAGDHGTTFGGGPFVASVSSNGKWLGEQLNAMALRTGRVRAVRGMGYMWGIDVVEKASDVMERAWGDGLLVITAGDHTLRLLPPLVMKRTDLERGLGMLERSLTLK